MRGYEKDNSYGVFVIHSEHVMACDETGRVIAVFHRAQDLDDVLEKILPPKDNQNAMDTAVDEAKERIKLKDQIAELKHENTMLRQKVNSEGYALVPKGWITVAECPNPDCIDGTYPDNYGGPLQCQFCDEKQAFLKAV